MERWNWFLSANYSGKWIITNGYAEVMSSGKRMQATLLFAPDADPYELLDITIGDSGTVEAFVKSLRSESTRVMHGSISIDATPEGEVISIFLNDGYTVLGLAKGARTDEANLA